MISHFANTVLPCEGRSGWTGYYSYHISRAQFSPDTWRKVTAALGPLDSDSPYDVGRAVAWWVQQIGTQNIATTAGWPVCGR